jgi:hypothetical protein
MHLLRPFPSGTNTSTKMSHPFWPSTENLGVWDEETRRRVDGTRGPAGAVPPPNIVFFITYKYFNCSAIKINISSIFMIILCIFCYEY